MSRSGDDRDRDRTRRALYWLGERLIEYRHPVMIVVLIVTAFFAYWTFQLQARDAASATSCRRLTRS